MLESIPLVTIVDLAPWLIGIAIVAGVITIIVKTSKNSKSNTGTIKNTATQGMGLCEEVYKGDTAKIMVCQKEVQTEEKRALGPPRTPFDKSKVPSLNGKW